MYQKFVLFNGVPENKSRNTIIKPKIIRFVLPAILKQNIKRENHEGAQAIKFTHGPREVRGSSKYECPPYVDQPAKGRGRKVAFFQSLKPYRVEYQWKQTATTLGRSTDQRSDSLGSDSER